MSKEYENTHSKVVMFKDALLLVSLGLVLRLPELLTRGTPSRDEAGYLAACFKLLDMEGFEGQLNMTDYDKVFFFLFVSPFVGLAHWITKDIRATAAAVSLFFSLLFIVVYYFVATKYFNRKTGWWVGFLTATIPAMVIWSSHLLTHSFYAYFFVLGAFFFWRYLYNDNMIFLYLASFTLASIARIRFEGIIVTAAFLGIVAWTMKVRKIKTSSALLQFSLLFLFTICVLVFYRMVSIAIYGSSSGGYGQLLAFSLGYLSNKLRVLFGSGTPGGFFDSDQLNYIINNLDTVGLSILAMAFDVLKTFFLIPVRLIPPLLFPALVFLLVPESNPDTKKNIGNRAINTLYSISLLSILVYPVFWYSSSRFAFLIVPVALLYLGRGLSIVEFKLNNIWVRGKFFFSGKSILAGIVLTYLCFINLNNYMLQIKGGDRLNYTKDAVEWINREFAGNDIAVYGNGYWTEYLELPVRRLVIDAGYVDGFWKIQPIPLSSTIEEMRQEHQALLVIWGEDVFGNPWEAFDERRHYFSTLGHLCLPFKDDGLESMDWHRQVPRTYIFQQFQPLLRGDVKISGLELIRRFGDGVNTVYIYNMKSGMN